MREEEYLAHAESEDGSHDMWEDASSGSGGSDEDDVDDATTLLGSSRGRENLAAQAYKYLTPKGFRRISRSDNRCRPPKLPSLLLRGKWRSIRMPSVEHAAMGEDYVVLWAMGRSSRVAKAAERLLNYHLVFYEEGGYVVCSLARLYIQKSSIS